MEPSGWKHVEDKKLKYYFRKCAFRWFILYNCITKRNTLFICQECTDIYGNSDVVLSLLSPLKI